MNHETTITEQDIKEYILSELEHPESYNIEIQNIKLDNQNIIVQWTRD